MPSEGPRTVPRMGSFKRALFGYRRPEVEAAISARDGQIGPSSPRSPSASSRPTAIAELEQELSSLSGDGDRARARDPRPDRAPARGQRAPRPQHRLARRGLGPAGGDPGAGPRPGDPDPDESAARGGRGEPARAGADRGPSAGRREDALAERRRHGNGQAEDFDGIFEGLVKLEIGPLGDFSQLVGFEDAVGQLGASEISVERFSEGRATLSMRLDQPVELLRELEELSSLDFKVRHTAPDNLILDVDEDQGPEQRAA